MKKKVTCVNCLYREEATYYCTIKKYCVTLASVCSEATLDTYLDRVLFANDDLYTAKKLLDKI